MALIFNDASKNSLTRDHTLTLTPLNKAFVFALDYNNENIGWTIQPPKRSTNN
jgi:hypothetical protein